MLYWESARKTSDNRGAGAGAGAAGILVKKAITKKKRWKKRSRRRVIMSCYTYIVILPYLSCFRGCFQGRGLIRRFLLFMEYYHIYIIFLFF
ncbi:hypothetical protein BDW42DRAFT_43307 [Aspergillus taichungensis]|uniref:Uncharacterized protein n=1 Tax=Aspergillus taichungensis TaxID=482145 RepID=A0A2J5HEB4_9EURO|nr:hypothetical protein BDW42DRAFT_43307 [Aspergillus taichungensis]